jgi:hypothetical protein
MVVGTINIVDVVLLIRLVIVKVLIVLRSPRHCHAYLVDSFFFFVN